MDRRVALLAVAASIALMVFSSVGYALTPIKAPENTVRVTLLGGPAAEINAGYNYDPLVLFQRIASRADANGNGIADQLEAKLPELGDEEISINIVFGERPAAFGGDANALLQGLAAAARIVEQYGGVVDRSSVWTNVLVGFNARVPASAVPAIAEALAGFDVDGDGVGARVLIDEDREVYAFNYFSSRQVAVRPWVWFDLGVSGQGVTVAVLDTGIDGDNDAFPTGKIVYWADYTGDPNGNTRDTPYDDNLHGTHVAGTVAGLLSSLDSQGRLVVNFGLSDLDSSNWPTGTWLAFRAPYMAYYVNTTGTIEINFKWKGDTTASRTTGTISAIGLAYCGWTPLSLCDYSNNVVASITTPNEDTWYTLTYDVTSPDQFGFYVVVFQVGTGGGFAMLPIMRWPVSTDYVTQNAPYLAGMAPNASLGGAKVLTYAGSGSTSDITSAIDDVVGNRTSVNPPMYIISMSLGGGYDSTLDAAVTNAVQAGVLVVVAAGNDGPNSDTANTGSPASNPYAITVAALDATNNITDYSSDGGPTSSDSLDSGDTYIKPDIAAPGGGNTLMTISADTTWHDDLLNAVSQLFWTSEDVDWPDTINSGTEGFDDSLGISGTSMATPHVSGIAALVIDALVNQAGLTWDWNSASTALFAKQIILISAYETYPLTREDNASYSPTLDKGGKDEHEGFGAIDAYAAVYLALSMGDGKALVPGSMVSGFELRPGVMYGNVDFSAGQWNFPIGHNVYASRVYLPKASFQLSDGTSYTITYAFGMYARTSDPANTDFDLYLYNMTPNKYGEPQIIASSVNGMGTTVETVTYTPSSDGESVIVAVKRAREDSAGGTFDLVVGPYMKLTGYDDFNQPQEGQAYTGRTLNVYLVSALGAQQAVLTFYDNTTGTVLDQVTVTLDTSNGYGVLDYNWTVPNDTTLDGHQLVVTAELQDANGNTISEGPAYSTATINASSVPIPEPPAAALAAALAAIVAALAVFRRR